MSVIIRAAVALKPGCQLVYDCPLKGDSFIADKFFDTYHGKVARFVDYQEQLIAPLDHLGRMPGRYVNTDGIKVRFIGKREVHKLNIRHFVVLNAACAKLVDPTTMDGRLGDLPHPVLFYPDDLVRLTPKAFKKGPWKTNEPRRIGSMLIDRMFKHNGGSGYEIFETESECQGRVTEERTVGNKRQLWGTHSFFGRTWNMAAQDLELIARGNVWALYNKPSKFSFSSDADEAAFWVRDGISHRVAGAETEQKGLQASIMNGVFGQTFASAHALFESGEVDIICVSEIKNRLGAPDRYLTRRLHDCFRKHRRRVRELTERVWAEKMKQSAA